MPYAFIHIPLHFTLHHFDHIPPSKPFSRSLGIYLLNTVLRYPDAPHSISKKKKYRIILFVSSLPLRKVSLFFLFLFFKQTHNIYRTVSFGNLSFSSFQSARLLLPGYHCTRISQYAHSFPSLLDYY